MNVKIKIDTCRYWDSGGQTTGPYAKLRNANDATEVKDGWALVSLRSEIGHKAAEQERACLGACETMLAGPIA